LVVDVHFINFQANFNLRTLRASLLTSGLNVTDQQLFFVDLLWEMMVEPGTGEPLRQASPDGKSMILYSGAVRIHIQPEFPQVYFSEDKGRPLYSRFQNNELTIDRSLGEWSIEGILLMPFDPHVSGKKTDISVALIMGIAFIGVGVVCMIILFFLQKRSELRALQTYDEVQRSEQMVRFAETGVFQVKQPDTLHGMEHAGGQSVLPGAEARDGKGMPHATGRVGSHHVPHESPWMNIPETRADFENATKKAAKKILKSRESGTKGSGTTPRMDLHGQLEVLTTTGTAFADADNNDMTQESIGVQMALMESALHGAMNGEHNSDSIVNPDVGAVLHATIMEDVEAFQMSLKRDEAIDQFADQQACSMEPSGCVVS